MKKRVRTTKARTDRLSLMASASMPLPAQVEPNSPIGEVPGLAVVPGPQFTELLAMLDRPADVPLELRRQVANRRWK